MSCNCMITELRVTRLDVCGLNAVDEEALDMDESEFRLLLLLLLLNIVKNVDCIGSNANSELGVSFKS